MGLVVAILALAITGCYTPSLRDCVVSCAAADDCAAGQACSSGWCAASPTTCTPAGLPGDAPIAVDATAMPVDAQAIDARVPDAQAPAQLHVMIMGTGQVTVTGVGTCTGGTPGNNGSCTYTVPTGSAQSAHATVLDSDHAFDKWTDPLCMDQDATCAFTVVPITTIQAHFK